MGFRKVDTGTKKDRIRRIGTIYESTQYKGVYLKIDPDCDLILYDRASKSYFRVNMLTAKQTSELAPKNAVLDLVVNLDNDKQVVFQAED